MAALVAIAFIVIAAFPYRAMLGTEGAARQTLQDFQFAYWPRRGWLLIHIAGGLIALLSGPVQLWLGIHSMKMDVHRKLGVLYMAGMTIGSLGRSGWLCRQTADSFSGPACSFRRAWIIDDEPCVRCNTERPPGSAPRMDHPELRRDVRVRHIPDRPGRDGRIRTSAFDGARHHGLGLLGSAVACSRTYHPGPETSKPEPAT